MDKYSIGCMGNNADNNIGYMGSSMDNSCQSIAGNNKGRNIDFKIHFYLQIADWVGRSIMI